MLKIPMMPRKTKEAIKDVLLDEMCVIVEVELETFHPCLFTFLTLL